MTEQIIKLISEATQTDISKISIETNLQEDLKLDSLDVVELAMKIEDEFQMEIPENEMSKLKTVKDITTYIESHKK